MKRRMVAMVVVWWLSVFLPDAHAAEYKLAMSEGKDVCQSMLTLANEGLLQVQSLENLSGPERLGVSFVKWERVKRAPSFQDHNGNVEGAVFDINNDGQLDWIVRIQWALGGLYGHEIGVYSRRQEPLFQDVGFDERDLGKADARLNLIGRQYFLTKIPQRKFKDGKSFYYEINPAYLIPFQFKNSTYMLMANPFAQLELLQDGRKFAVVAKYLSTFQLLDSCYIEEARSKTNTR